MNCQDFQEQLFEYLDGTLPTGTHQDIDQHLAACLTCRQALAKHRQLARTLTDQLCRSVESVTLDAAVRCRILAALPTRAAPADSEKFLAHLWRPLAWAVGIACLLVAGVLLGNYWFGARHDKSWIGPRVSSKPVPVSIRVARIETTYTFRKEGEFVTDTLVRHTNLVCETIWANLPSKPAIKGPANKMSL